MAKKLNCGFLHSLLYPVRCPYCNKLIERHEYACKDCLRDIPENGIEQGVLGGYRCCSPLPYTGNFKKAMLRFKLGGKRRYAKRFAPLLYKQIKESYEDTVFDYITFVPMHKVNLRQRGFNQSELLALELSNLMKIPYFKVIEKDKITHSQHGLKLNQRRTNLKGAFKVIDKQKIEGRSILLLDDIITTGSTLGECAKTLQKAKPSYICCVTLLSVANLY